MSVTFFIHQHCTCLVVEVLEVAKSLGQGQQELMRVRVAGGWLSYRALYTRKPYGRKEWPVR